MCVLLYSVALSVCVCPPVQCGVVCTSVCPVVHTVLLYVCICLYVYVHTYVCIM